MSSPPVLFVHPYGHLNDLVVPTGTLTCLNSLSVPKLGRYAFEVSDAEIRAARIIAIDLHWALAITGFERLVHHVRQVNPEAAVVVGGVTAGHYPAELLDRHPIDYVLRGDSEISFRALVDAILSAQPTDLIPNVVSRSRPVPILRRMTDAEFDATDCLTADWFPTYERVSRWDAVAFPQGRTIAVSRGCAFTCPECYGSYASTFGRGYLMRSPQGVIGLLRRAEAMQVRNLRLFVAKPAPARLSALLQALAQAGPFRFESSVGFYLCMPPQREDVRALEAAFDKEVAISMIPPEEHVPALKPRELEVEQHGWTEVAHQVGASERLLLDVWTTTRGEFESTREAFRAIAPSPRVKVSFGAVWSVTRPTDSGDKPSYDEVRNAVLPLWTFYLGRLLSPALSSLLEPFQFLDELPIDPDSLARPTGVLSPFFDRLIEAWQRDHLATIPGLKLTVVPVRVSEQRRGNGDAGGRKLQGQLCHLRSDAIQWSDLRPQDLTVAPDQSNIRLRVELGDLPDADALAFLPRLAETPPPPPEDMKEIAATGLVALVLPKVAGGRRHDVGLDVVLRAQAAFVRLSAGAGQTLAAGRADLGYFRPREMPAAARVNVQQGA